MPLKKVYEIGENEAVLTLNSIEILLINKENTYEITSLRMPFFELSKIFRADYKEMTNLVVDVIDTKTKKLKKFTSEMLKELQLTMNDQPYPVKKELDVGGYIVSIQ